MRYSFAVLALLSSSMLLSGCSNVFTVVARDASAVKVLPYKGGAHGGQQPIAGAHVYLMAAGTSGYGGASVSLLNAAATGHADGLGAYVTTDADGSFSITGDYTCASTSQLYIYVLGGDGGAGNNNAAGLMAALGTCGGGGNLAATVPYIWINEVSTVAAAYALAPYALDATHVGSSGSPLALTGIANAFAGVSNLVSINTGIALATTPAGNGMVPQAEINTLANVLAACVNSNGGVSTPCGAVFMSTTNGTSSPSDTATAAMNIARHPGVNVNALFGLQGGVAQPFMPALNTAPGSWLMAITYTGGGMQTPQSPTIDAQGNVWTGNIETRSGSGYATVVNKFSPLGVPASATGFSGGGISSPTSLAFDAQGNVWIADRYASAVSELSNAGVALSPATGYGTNYFGNDYVALDKTGNVWMGNGFYGAPLRFSANAPASQTTFSGGGTGNAEIDLKIDGLGNVWMTNYNTNTVSELSGAGVPVSASGFKDSRFSGLGSFAFDAANNVWIVNSNNANLVKFTNSGSTQTVATYAGGGMTTSNGFVAIDGLGNAWTPSPSTGVVSEFTAAGGPVVGDGYSVAPVAAQISGVAIDGSGNVWVTGFSNTTLIELVGAAAPVSTPVLAQATNNTFGTRP
jgi:hypothetical protein